MFFSVQIREFTEDLATNYNEYLPLEYLWQTCILSEWFSDQTTALQMIEDNPKLRKYLSEKYKHIVSVALKTNKSDVVQRLFELFLKYKMTENYISTLRQLFDHHCKFSFGLEVLNRVFNDYSHTFLRLLSKPSRL